jgi:hypothetical protein
METMLDPHVNALADENISVVLLVQSLQPRRKIHDVAERGVIHPFGRAEITDHGLADVNPEAGMKRLQSFRLELAIDRLIGGLRLQRGAAGAFAMIGLPVRRVPERHHGVSDELVDGAALRQNDIRQCGEVTRRLLHQCIRLHTLGNRGEASDIGEERGDLLSGAAKLGGYGIVEYTTDDFARRKARMNGSRAAPDGSCRPASSAP